MTTEQTDRIKLVYTLFCDDVRLEVGNKLSLMGVFQNIGVPQLPISVMKFAVVSHWTGEGSHQLEVRILSPHHQQILAASQPTRLDVTPGGFAGNVSFFVNVTFSVAGQYWVQTLIDSTLFNEQPLTVADSQMAQEEDFSEAVN